jgi:hypothetical protein
MTICDYLNKWIINHILLTDKKLEPFFSGKLEKTGR